MNIFYCNRYKLFRGKLHFLITFDYIILGTELYILDMCHIWLERFIRYKMWDVLLSCVQSRCFINNTLIHDNTKVVLMHYLLPVDILLNHSLVLPVLTKVNRRIMIRVCIVRKFTSVKQNSFQSLAGKLRQVL